MPRPLIDMIIVGAAKSGTTSLLRYLGQHPEVCPQREPEFAYFVLDGQYARGYESAFDRYFGGCGRATKVVAKNVGLMYLRAARRPEMDPRTRARLEERFSPMIARLEQLAGRSLWR